MQIENGLFKIDQCDLAKRIIFNTDWVVELGSDHDQYHPFPTWKRAWAFAFESGYYPHPECLSRELITHPVWCARLRWIDHLLKPDTKKMKRMLESYDSPHARCCLGHACYVLGADRKVEDQRIYYDSCSATLPTPIIDKLCMHDDLGHGKDITKLLLNSEYNSLSSLNDATEATPQDIGKYLMTVIRGGDLTPFREIKL